MTIFIDERRIQCNRNERTAAKESMGKPKAEMFQKQLVTSGNRERLMCEVNQISSC